jgi:LysM repeat protein
VFVDGKYFEIDPKTSAEVNFATWFAASTGTMTTEGLSKVNSGVTVKSIVQNPTGLHYLLTPEGKRPIINGTEVVADAPIVSDAFLNAIPSDATSITAPAFIRGAGDKTIYYVNAKQRRATLSAADRALLSFNMYSTGVIDIGASALEMIKLGPPVIAESAVVRSTKTGLTYWITGPNTMARVENANQATQFGLAKARSATSAQLAGYRQNAKLTGVKASCGAQEYIVASGKYFKVDAAASVHYPGAALKLTDTTCSKIVMASVDIGRFIRTPDKVFWLIQNGKKRQISNAARYESLRAGGLQAVNVDSYFASRIATGSAAPAVLVEPTVAPTPTPTATSTPIPSPTTTRSPSPTPTRTATPTPTPTRTVTPTVTPSPTSTSFIYTVVSGDTLSGLAVRFKRTVSAIRTANKLTSDVIRIGQRLLIP